MMNSFPLFTMGSLLLILKTLKFLRNFISLWFALLNSRKKKRKKENKHFNFSFIFQGSSVSTLDSNTKKRVKTIFQCSIDKKGLLTNEVVHLLKKRKIIVKVQLKKKQLEYTRWSKSKYIVSNGCNIKTMHFWIYTGKDKFCFYQQYIDL